MTTDRVPLSFTSKATYLVAAAVVLVFVAMLGLTVLHP